MEDFFIMKKSILASSLAVALGVTGYATQADNNEAHASESNIDKAHLAELAQSNAKELNEKPLHAGAYNYDFVLNGFEYSFKSNGEKWSWSYKQVGSQSAASHSTASNTSHKDVSAQVSHHSNEKSSNQVSAQKQSNNVQVEAVQAPKASSNNNVQKAQTSTQSSASSNDTSSIDAIAQQMAERTGVSASQWKGVIQRESGGNPHAVNASSGAYGLFQLLGHGEHSGMSVQEQINTAAQVYKQQGSGAWVGW